MGLLSSSLMQFESVTCNHGSVMVPSEKLEENTSCMLTFYAFQTLYTECQIDPLCHSQHIEQNVEIFCLVTVQSPKCRSVKVIQHVTVMG
jgi:hypothetical protein